MLLDFEAADNTAPQTPAALRDILNPRPRIVRSTPIACRPSCLMARGCSDCDSEIADSDAAELLEASL